MSEALKKVRAALIAKGTSLHCLCADIGVDRSYAAKAIAGTATFPAAVELRTRIFEAAGLDQLGKPKIADPLAHAEQLKQRIRDLESLLKIARFPTRSTPIADVKVLS